MLEALWAAVPSWPVVGAVTSLVLAVLALKPILPGASFKAGTIIPPVP